MDSILLKYALNPCVVDSIKLPDSGLAAVGVPTETGMRLFCNCEQTAYMLAAEFEGDVIAPDDCSNRHSVQLDFHNRRDRFRFALLNLLRNAQYGVVEQGDVPWHVLGIRF